MNLASTKSASAGVEAAQPPDPESTRERLLEAAEASFAHHGFAGTSIRKVTQAAGVSVSAANYHFGSKRALVHAALLRCIEPLNREREDAVAAVVEAAGDAPPELEAVLRAFLQPVLDSEIDDRARYRAIVSRLYVEPRELVTGLKRTLFGPLTEVVIDALMLSLPGHARRDMTVAFQITVGVIVHFTSGQIGTAPGLDLSEAPDADELVERVPAFCAAGLRAYLELAGAR